MVPRQEGLFRVQLLTLQPPLDEAADGFSTGKAMLLSLCAQKKIFHILYDRYTVTRALYVHHMEYTSHLRGFVMPHIARHICQSVMGVFAAMYSLGGTPASYTATSANALAAAAWRQTGTSLRAARQD